MLSVSAADSTCADTALLSPIAAKEMQLQLHSTSDTLASHSKPKNQQHASKQQRPCTKSAPCLDDTVCRSALHHTVHMCQREICIYALLLDKRNTRDMPVFAGRPASIPCQLHWKQLSSSLSARRQRYPGNQQKTHQLLMDYVLSSIELDIQSREVIFLEFLHLHTGGPSL